jgi:hypothetical protein
MTEESASHVASSTRFITYDNGTVLDSRTQLMWMSQDYQNLQGRAPFGWPEALEWPATINQQQYGGYRDWRVPTVQEYKTFYTPAKPRLSYRGKAVGYPAVFAGGGGEWCWTVDVAKIAQPPMMVRDAYTFNFRSGWHSPRYIYVHRWRGRRPAETTGSVRLVRGPLSASR